MNHYERVDDMLSAVARARKFIAARKSKQVRSSQERIYIQSVASLWFDEHRPDLAPLLVEEVVEDVDRPFRKLLDSTAKEAARSTYQAVLKQARKALLRLHEGLPAKLSEDQVDLTPTPDIAPDFAPLANDDRMQTILQRRWSECVTCLQYGAHLAAVVMMGGLLESLFVSKQNHVQDKSLLTTATSAPRHNGKIVPLQKWTLNHYIEVGHEIGWIGDAARRVGGLLRDYRNLVHPQAEYAQRIVLTPQDSRILWEIAKSVIRELLNSEQPG